MARAVDPARACLPVATWPEIDRRRWNAMVARTGTARFTERHAATRLRPASLEKYAEGYGRWLGFLQQEGWLDADATPAARVTAERLANYFDKLLALGNRPYTIAGRFDELRRALSLLEPGQCFRRVTHPGGRSIRDYLDLRPGVQEVHHPADLLLWGVELMQQALERSPRRRQVQLRDGLLIAILAFRGLRLRSVLSLRVGHSVQREVETGRWRLEIDGGDVKNERYIAAQLPEILGPWIERYVNVERRELLARGTTDAFWVNWGGQPLGEVGLDKRIRWHSGKRFGVGRAFGTHRFRYCIATTAPLLMPDHPGLAAALLRITGDVAAEHYDRGDAVLAFKRYHKAIGDERRRTAALARTTRCADGALDVHINGGVCRLTEEITQ